MKKIITAFCLIAVLACATSCTRGGNVDKGHNGNIGKREDDYITYTRGDDKDGKGNGIKDGIDDGMNDIKDDVDDGMKEGRRIINGAENDIYNLPSEIRDGANDLMPNVGAEIRR